MDIKIFENMLPPMEETSLRKLWKDSFHDSEAYLDFFFGQVCRSSRCWSLWEDGQLLSMLYADPYRISVNGQLMDSYYIVGVATDSGYRRKGAMRQLMEHALDTFRAEAVPFVYLMPAREEYYTPFGFVSLSGHTWLKLSCSDGTQLSPRIFSRVPTTGLPGTQLTLTPLNSESPSCLFSKLSEFANRVLSQEYTSFTHRTPDYYRRSAAELTSEEGEHLLFLRENQLMGSLLYTAESGVPQLLELLSDEKDKNLLLKLSADILEPSGKAVWLPDMTPKIMFCVLDPHFPAELLNDAGIHEVI